MVRLMLVLAPVMCILSGIGLSSTLTTYMKNLDSTRKEKKIKRSDSSYPLRNEVCLHVYIYCVLYIMCLKYLAPKTYLAEL